MAGGMPHTKAIDDGLFELQRKSKEGIGRVFYCTLIGNKIVMLLTFI
jgi:phage-related protein